MLNIRNIGTLKSEADLTAGKSLPQGAHQFKESTKFSDIFYDGAIIALPGFVALIALAIYRSSAIKSSLHFTTSTWITLIVTGIILYFVSYVHELIHAAFYPSNSSKVICQIPDQGAHLLYCDAVVSKGRFVLICLAPALCLSILPFLLWYILAPFIPMPYNFAIVIFTLFTFVSAIGDYANVFNTLRQVPNGAKVFNYGMHSYWMK